jgi:hypothetical protein
MRKFFFFLIFLPLIQVSAQRNCGTMDHLEHQMLHDKDLKSNMEAIEKHTESYVANPVKQRAIVTIPVVVHVLYATAAQNISDAQINSQIAVLNQDFRKLNPDIALTPALFAGLTADSEIEFCLAKRTPTGTATTGINRKSTTVTSWGTNDNIKRSSNGGIDTWDRNQYLNIWVGSIGGGILGYAQFPGGVASTDGVVIDFRYFGTTGTATAPFNLGRTATHEVGHWLNLRHIWGDANCGSDLVNDTPVHNTSNGGCPSFPHLSTCTGNPTEMTMNYMDYTNDNCMYMFSTGQSVRMNAVLSPGGSRSSLLTSLGCTPPSSGGTCNVPAGNGTSNITTSSATLSWASVVGAASYNVQWKLASASTWNTISNISGTSTNLTGLSPNTSYNWGVQTVCSSSSSAFSSNTFNTTSAGCSDAFEPNNSRSAAKPFPASGNLSALINTGTDTDWFSFTTTSTSRNVRLTLSNLPADYDLQLVRSNGSVLSTSQNGSTTNEIITLNNAPIGTLFARVYPYQGVSSPLCYNLSVQVSSTAFREGEGLQDEIVPKEKIIEGTLTLLPNPASDEFSMSFNAAEGEGKISIMSLDGKMVKNNVINLIEGYNMERMSISDLPSGLYIVTLQQGNSLLQNKLMIMR